jgi:hypothetical protein
LNEVVFSDVVYLRHGLILLFDEDCCTANVVLDSFRPLKGS